MNTKQLSALAVKALEDMKGQDIVCLNVKKLTQITDYMVIVTGTSTTHLRSLADELGKQVKAAGEPVLGDEVVSKLNGYSWIWAGLSFISC